jgi:tetratricopeptide (TPR) repeat protein
VRKKANEIGENTRQAIGNQMMPLPRPIVLILEAAEGWLMLSNPFEADAEVEKVEAEFLFHPLVLATRWEIYSALRWWEVAWQISRFLCERQPDHAAFWICQADSLRHLRGVKMAKDFISSVANRFPKEPLIAYNLACYLCQLGQTGEACRWLIRAFQADPTIRFKLMALQDSDLTPLWTRIAASATPAANGQAGGCLESITGLE